MAVLKMRSGLEFDVPVGPAGRQVLAGVFLPGDPVVVEHVGPGRVLYVDQVGYVGVQLLAETGTYYEWPVTMLAHLETHMAEFRAAGGKPYGE